MRKIKSATHTNKDRIVCINTRNKQAFYYQAEGVNERNYLFETKASPSVWEYFRNKGHRINDESTYFTVGEMYRFRNYHHNVKLTRIIERIPTWIDYVLANDEVSVIKPAVATKYSDRKVHDEFADERAA